MIHAVGSGVGTAALQLALAADARVVGTSRTEWKLERASELGLTDAILPGEDWPDRVLDVTNGRGVDVIQGGDGNDSLHGGSEIDFLFGDDGQDHLYGDSGDDAPARREYRRRHGGPVAQAAGRTGRTGAPTLGPAHCLVTSGAGLDHLCIRGGTVRLVYRAGHAGLLVDGRG